MARGGLRIRERFFAASKRGKINATRDALIMLAASVVLLPAFVVASGHAHEVSAPITSLQFSESVPSGTITLALGGDVSLGEAVLRAATRTPESLYGDAAPLFASADLSAVHLETAILEDPVPTDNRAKSLMISAPPSMLSYLQETPILFMANAHAADHGRESVTATLAHLRDAGFLPAGSGKHQAEAIAPVVVDVGDVSVAFISFTDVPDEDLVATFDQPGIAASSLRNLLPAVRQAAALADFVVVGAHWGVEYQTAPTARQEELALLLADAGADVIVGAHPKMLQRVEMVGNTLVFYSLSSLITELGWSDTRETVVPTIVFDADSRRATVVVEPFRVKEGRPRTVGGGVGYRRNTALAKLTHRTNIAFERDGTALVASVSFLGADLDD